MSAEWIHWRLTRAGCSQTEEKAPRMLMEILLEYIARNSKYLYGMKWEDTPCLHQFQMVAGQKPIPRGLYLKVKLHGPKVFRTFSEHAKMLSPILNGLEAVIRRSSCNADESIRSDGNPLKLRYLKLNSDTETFPLCLEEESLAVMILDGSMLTRSHLDTIRKCSNLVYLSLHEVKLVDDVKVDEVIEVLVTLVSLRCLNVIGMVADFSDLYRLCANLRCLEVLACSGLVRNDKELDFANPSFRKIKQIISDQIIPTVPLYCLANKDLEIIGRREIEKHLLKMMNSSPQ